MSRLTTNGQARNAKDITDLIHTFTSGVTLTAQAAAETVLGGTFATEAKIDCDIFEQVRLVFPVTTVSASGASPAVYLKYRIAHDGTIGNWTSVPLATGSLFTGATVADSGWVDLPVAARIKNCFFVLAAIGGNASASPVIGTVTAQFR